MDSISGPTVDKTKLYWALSTPFIANILLYFVA